MGLKNIRQSVRRYNPLARLIRRLARENLPTSTEPRQTMKWCATCSRYHKGSAMNGDCNLTRTLGKTRRGIGRFILTHPDRREATFQPIKKTRPLTRRGGLFKAR